ncbi:FkbM family methyltransferase [Neorhizobium galegae]|uniref:FkbM family methyltransferase n=1 Tax=Neorhizobium galegae TaxID=399 RepID=UPI0027822F00|nr:FkbM family methyltransferase [Neorhizobium galegae]MDQ0136301.1 FkbM family methyltransferase [Neorhizobium galegae]
MRKSIGRTIVEPLRRRQFARESDVFIHRTNRGYIFKLDPAQSIDEAIFVDGWFEGRFLEFLQGRFEPGAVALDVGANIGNHAIHLSRDFAEIHCFEPNPEVFRRLTDNVRSNRLDNIRLHQAALGDCDDTLMFRENLEGNLGASGFVEDDRPSGHSRILRLPVFDADKLVQRLGITRVDFIKIDVEGFELRVLKGLRATIAFNRPIVSFEFHGHLAGPDDFGKLTACLPDYRFYDLEYAPESASTLEKLKWNFLHGSAPVLKRFDRPEPRTYENILAFPSRETFRRFMNRPSVSVSA